MRNLAVFNLVLLLSAVGVITTGIRHKPRTGASARTVAFRFGVQYPGTGSDSPFVYPFIDRDKNVIIRQGPDPMQHFYLALDSLAGGSRQKVNVVHIGDSHVQADIFPGKLREGFQRDSSLGNGGRGFVFPYAAVRTNAPVNLKVTYTGYWTGCRNVERDRACGWGLAGITATTYAANATFTVDPNAYAPTGLTYPITRVRIFYDVHNPAMFSVNLLNEEVVMSRRVDERGFMEFSLQQPVSQVVVGFEKTSAAQTGFTLQGISVENDQPGAQYHSVGVNGAEVTSFLRSPLLEKNLSVLQPDLVIVSLGTNDAYPAYFDAHAFKRNYGTLIQRIKRAAPNASVLLTTPGDCYRRRRYINYNNAKAAKQLFDLAEETGSAVWDFYAVMGGLKSVQQWYANGLAAADKVHLTRKGYVLQGNLLFEALMNDYAAFGGGAKVQVTDIEPGTDVKK